ncbi:MAG: MipA/OmpV family protein [Piscinibacter sp.]|nr:MipA/OmpV family protein [Piscinibacter sp.]
MARQLALAIVMGGALAGASAQQAGHDDPQGSQWGLGLGVLVKKDAYKGIKRDTQVVPLLRFENEYLEFEGLGLEVKLPSLRLGEGHEIRFGIVGEFDPSGYKAKDAPSLAGMTERKGGFWVGAKVEWENEFVNVSAALTADASGHSKGRKFSLGLEKEWQLGQNTMVVPYITANWLDKKVVDYYYGVRAAEVTAERAAHVGKAAMNVDVGVRTMYQFDQHHSMLLDVSITRLAKQIKASPLVDRSSTSQAILGYMYSF